MTLSSKQISLVFASALLSIAIFVAHASGDLQVAPPQPQPDVSVAPPEPQPDVSVAPPQPQPDVSVQPPTPGPDLQNAAPAPAVQPAAPAETVQPAAPAETVQPAAPAETVQPAAPAETVQQVDVGGPAATAPGADSAGAVGDSAAAALNSGRGATRRGFRARSSEIGRTLRKNPSGARRSLAAGLSVPAGREARIAGVVGAGSSALGVTLDYRSQRDQGYSAADSAGYAAARQLGGSMGARVAGTLCFGSGDFTVATAACVGGGDVVGQATGGLVYKLGRWIKRHGGKRCSGGDAGCSPTNDVNQVFVAPLL